MSDVAALTEALESATTAPAIVAALARAIWHNAHNGADCPVDQVPDETALLAWLPQCPQQAQDDARKVVAKLLVEGEWLDERAGWTALGDPAEREAAEAEADEAREMLRKAIGADELPWRFDPEKFIANTLPRIARLGFAITRFLPISPIGRMPGGMGISEFGVCEAPEIHRCWLELPEPRPRHPLAPILTAWLERPVEVAANTRTDRARILPAQLAMFDAPAGDLRGRLFSAPWRGNSQLPLFEVGSHGAEYVTPALPVALYELGVGHELSNRGSGAPLALRLFVEAILASPMHGRELRKPIALNEVSVRYMLSRLYPGRRPKPNEWRPLIEAAKATLASRDAAIRWDDGVPRSAVLITSFPEAPGRSGTDHRGPTARRGARSASLAAAAHLRPEAWPALSGFAQSRVLVA